MNKKFSIKAIALIIIIVLLTILIVSLSSKEKDILPKKYEYKRHTINTPNTTFKEDYYTIIGLSTTKEDYNNILLNNNISIKVPVKKDYENYNYLLVVMKYDTCSEKIIEKEITINEDKVIVEFDIDRKCGLCNTEYLLYEISLPKTINTRRNAEIKINYLDKALCKK